MTIDNINIIIKKRKRKNAKIVIDKTGTVIAHVPHSYTDKIINEMIKEKEEWIIENIKKINLLNAKRLHADENEIIYLGEKYKFIFIPAMGSCYNINDSEKTISSGRNLLNKDNLLVFYKKQADLFIKSRIYKESDRNNIDIKRITIRNMKTKWGSFSSQNHITINERLILAPVSVIDAIINHELAHSKHMNHSKQFYNELEKMYPDYKNADVWLKEFMPLSFP